MLTPSLGKSPGQAAIWLLVAMLAIWSTRSEYSSSDNHLYHSSGYSALRVGIMAEAYPFPPHCPPPAPVDSTTDETREFVESLFTAVALDNFGQSFAAALADSLVWTVTGSSPIAGTYNGKQVYVDEVLTPLRAVLVSSPCPSSSISSSTRSGLWSTGGVKERGESEFTSIHTPFWTSRI